MHWIHFPSRLHACAHTPPQTKTNTPSLCCRRPDRETAASELKHWSERINIPIKISLDFDLPDNYPRVPLFSGLLWFDEVCYSNYLASCVTTREKKVNFVCSCNPCFSPTWAVNNCFLFLMRWEKKHDQNSDVDIFSESTKFITKLSAIVLLTLWKPVMKLILCTLSNPLTAKRFLLKLSFLFFI